MAAVDVNRLITAFPPGTQTLGNLTITTVGARRGISPGGTFEFIWWGTLVKSGGGAGTWTWTQGSPLIWTEPKGGTTTAEAQAAFASMLDGVAQ